jgi:hypothetical protein
MSLSIGIVGLPNVGKSTLFKALTKNPVDINNYPFCTIEPNVGIVKVPDKRLEKLAKLSQSKKIIPTIIEFVDIAGLVKGASKGEGLGNKFLANIREVDAIAHIVRVFENDNITHVDKSIDPQRDIDVINTELILKDLETLEKTRHRLEKDARGQDKEAQIKLEVVEKLISALQAGKMAHEVELNMENDLIEEIIREISLITMKPVLYVYNVNDINKILPKELEEKPHVKLDIKTEEDILDLSPEDAKELGAETNLEDLILKSYQLLNLITYLTTGPEETRAWTTKKDSLAPQAGAAIHTDFEEKFVKAEVIKYEDFTKAGSEAAARDQGLIKLAGKDYIVQDGDVMNFKIGG